MSRTDRMFEYNKSYIYVPTYVGNHSSLCSSYNTIHTFLNTQHWPIIFSRASKQFLAHFPYFIRWISLEVVMDCNM